MSSKASILPGVSLFNIVFCASTIFISLYFLTTEKYWMAFLPSMGLIAFLVLGKWPQIALYGIIFLIPSDALRVLGSLSQAFTISKVLGVILIAIVSLYIVTNNIQISRFSSNLWAWFIFFLLLSLASTFLSDYRATSYDNIRKLLVAYVFFSLVISLVSKKGFENVSKIIIFSVSMNALISVIDYHFGIGLTAGSAQRRAVGTSVDANLFSAMIIFTFPLQVHALFTYKGIIKKTITLALTVINVYSIMLTNSRAGAMVFALIFLIVFITYIRRLRFIHIFVFIILVAISVTTITFFVPDKYIRRIKSVVDITDQSIGRRSSYIYVAMESVKEKPFVGYGPGTFRELYALSNYAYGYAHGGEEESYRRYAHNSYIEVIVGTGLLGIIFYAVIIFIGFRNFTKASKYLYSIKYNDIASLVTAYKLSFIAILIYMTFISINYHKYFWLCLALSQIALNIANDYKDEQKEEPRPIAY